MQRKIRSLVNINWFSKLDGIQLIPKGEEFLEIENPKCFEESFNDDGSFNVPLAPGVYHKLSPEFFLIV